MDILHHRSGRGFIAFWYVRGWLETISTSWAFILHTYIYPISRAWGSSGTLEMARLRFHSGRRGIIKAIMEFLTALLPSRVTRLLTARAVVTCYCGVVYMDLAVADRSAKTFTNPISGRSLIQYLLPIPFLSLSL